MGTFNFILVLGGAVLASSVINQVVRGVSTPLIQIAIGVLLALFGFTTSSFTVDPELFLVLFIAPLLFDEARAVDKVALWSNRDMIASLAIALVVVTLLAVGFLVNALVPSVPLAAAFALGAALGPTDAVAVASLSRRASLTRRQEVLLSGESLINDASGVVSFQFAVAAVTTGAFSFLDASASFFAGFFGGIGLGLAMAALLAFAVDRVRGLGLEDTTFHVLFEVLTPFIVFLAAEAVHVSGILAVVAAGLLGSFLNRHVNPDIARMKIVSTSVWRVLSFALNGVVFVLLGAQLPNAMRDMWEDPAIGNPELIAIVILLSAVVIAVRTVWFLGISYVGRKNVAREEQRNSGGTPEQVAKVIGSVRVFTRESLRESCTLALAGPKGAITLSIMFTMPYAVSQAGAPFTRDLLIFLASGVILCTLLLANFVLPLLAPKKEGEGYETDEQATMEVLRAVIEELAARQTKDNRRATQVVMKQYSDRIARLKQHAAENDDDAYLRIKVLAWEEERVLALLESDEADPVAAYRLLRRIQQSMELLDHGSKAQWLAGMLYARLRSVLHMAAHMVSGRASGLRALDEERAARDLQAVVLEDALAKLRGLLDDPAYRTEHVSALMAEKQRELRRVKRIRRSVGTETRVQDKANEMRRIACFLELEQIQQMYESGRIDRATAKHMRENVHMMQIDLEDRI